MENIIMKKAGLVLIAIGCLIMITCTNNVLTGQTVKETRDLPSFSGVALAFSGNVYITQGSPQRVEIEADKATLDIILSEIDGNDLVLKTKNGHWHDLGQVNVYITMPQIDQLAVSGSGDIICDKPVKTGEIELSVSGSGSLKMKQLEAAEISANITGSGDISIAGSGPQTKELEAVITGSGDFESEMLPVTDVSVEITGSGSARVNAVSELETNITGSGSVLYKGSPLINANATGSGKTRPIN